MTPSDGHDAPDTAVCVQWDARTEHVRADVDHAMLVLPEGERAPDDPESSHRLFFAGTPERQAQMIAVVVAYMIETGLAPVVGRILSSNPGPGDIRGWTPPTVGEAP